NTPCVNAAWFCTPPLFLSDVPALPLPSCSELPSAPRGPPCPCLRSRAPALPAAALSSSPPWSLAFRPDPPPPAPPGHASHAITSAPPASRPAFFPDAPPHVRSTSPPAPPFALASARRGLHP